MNWVDCITMSGFLAACVFGIYRRQWAAVPVAAAFLLSLAGDYFLRNRGGGHEYYFLFGIAAFFLAHTGFLVFALSYGRINRYVLGIALPIYLIYCVFFLMPVMPDAALGAAVLLYTVISVVGLGAAAGIRGTMTLRGIYTAGIAFILFSDTVISWKEFLNFHRFNGLIMPAYMLAHLLLAAALVLMTVRPGYLIEIRPVSCGEKS